jgi:ubiquinone/menaquinone biosynthesis C-methylase UbiE
MLRQAQDYWVKGKTLELDLSKRGFENVILEGKNLTNLNFGLAKAKKLPFANASLDIVCSSFLIDRVEEPLQALKEMHRVLKVGGVLLSVTPLNFQKTEHWKAFYPFSKLEEQMRGVGFQVIKNKEEFVVKEYLDVNRNAVEWKCVAFLAHK